ncbi:MAG: hypothetical protein LBE82_05600 [Chitinophagaceae bacterium]|nr:hypothetical protein [Chitinophagaceae bacterium]
MKKYICFSIVMLLCLVLFSQKAVQKDSVDKNAYIWKEPIRQQDNEERRKANMEPIVKRVYDTLGYDYLEQHFYHNGNLYYQITFENGKQNGLFEEYHPNGQLNYKQERKDGRESDRCNFISFDRFGDTCVTVICILYDNELYSFQTDYVFGRIFSLIIRNSNNVMVAEFEWAYNNKWVKRDYHVKSVKYANKLLKLYKRRTVQALYHLAPTTNSKE